jgi:hypothetical protein
MLCCSALRLRNNSSNGYFFVIGPKVFCGGREEYSGEREEYRGELVEKKLLSSV